MKNKWVLGLTLLVLLTHATMAQGVVPDANLAAAIQQALGLSSNRTLTSQDLQGLTVLKATSSKITDLRGLEHATNLERLDLSDNEISDITPLVKLTHLWRLYLNDNEISDITPLAKLTHLQELYLSDNEISDSTPFAKLTHLWMLDLRDNEISDITPFAKLTHLERLELTRNEISDITPLIERLWSLHELYLGYNKISNISEINNITPLAKQPDHVIYWAHRTGLKLGLSGNEISDITPLAKLTHLRTLYLSNNEISDITPLAKLTHLEWLYLSGNEISDITPLAKLTHLEWLHLRYNEISDITPLAKLTHLEWLHLGGNEIRDFSPLAGLRQLEKLYLQGSLTVNEASLHKLLRSNPNLKLDIQPMPGLIPDGNLAVDIREALDIGLGSRFTKQNLNSLSYLLSNHSGVRDITGLEHATNLERLFLRYNEISDITPLAKLTHLEHLDLSGNEISDITPLAKLTHLRTLYLDDNEISDITPLAKLTKLKQLRLAGNKISDTTPLQLFQQDPNLFVDIDLETPKIEGPWLWMIVPTEQKADAKAALEKDYLAAATKGVVTEQQIATNGATPGDTVGDMVWTLGKIAPLGSNNITHTVNTIGLGHGGSVINNHVAYASISLDSPRKQNTRMYVGSNESVKVWLNGVLVHKKPVYRDRPADDYQYTFRVTLKQGKNIFLIAVYNTSGAWSGFFGFKNDVVYSVSTTPIIHVGAPQRPPMYWIDTNAGTLHRLIGNEVEDLLPNVQNATSLAMDPAVGRLYWTEKTGKRAGKIKRANLDGSNIKLIKDLTSVPYDIAVDTANNKLYLTNAWGKVQRLNIDGSNIQPNLITGLKSPKHLTLDVTGGKVYWTEQVGSTTGKIQRANLDGTNVELLKELTSVPHGLAIDPANNKLYLTNAYGKIQCLNIDGSNIQPNLITDLDAPKSLVVDSAGGKVYWTEQGSIRRANRNGNNIQNVVTGLGTVDRITLGFAPTPGLIAAAPTKTDPDQTALLANYPNPFNPETWIPYQLAEPSDVKITIYNTHEVVVRQLGLGHQPAGIYTNRSRAAYWDGRNNQGERVASGIYFYQLQTDNISSLRKMLILK